MACVLQQCTTKHWRLDLAADNHTVMQSRKIGLIYAPFTKAAWVQKTGCRHCEWPCGNEVNATFVHARGSPFIDGVCHYASQKHSCFYLIIWVFTQSGSLLYWYDVHFNIGRPRPCWIRLKIILCIKHLEGVMMKQGISCCCSRLRRLLWKWWTWKKSKIPWQMSQETGRSGVCVGGQTRTNYIQFNKCPQPQISWLFENRG